jgi:hypothetical protein
MGHFFIQDVCWLMLTIFLELGVKKLNKHAFNCRKAATVDRKDGCRGHAVGVVVNDAACGVLQADHTGRHGNVEGERLPRHQARRRIRHALLAAPAPVQRVLDDGGIVRADVEVVHDVRIGGTLSEVDSGIRRRVPGDAKDHTGRGNVLLAEKRALIQAHALFAPKACAKTDHTRARHAIGCPIVGCERGGPSGRGNEMRAQVAQSHRSGGGQCHFIYINILFYVAIMSCGGSDTTM